MDTKKFRKLVRELEDLRRTSPKALAIERLAKKLGRVKVNRGKEPTWVSEAFPALRPLSIPRHGGKDLSPGVKNTVLAQLEGDLFAWEAQIEANEKGHGQDGK
jgi:hypothetical protein